MFNKSLEQIFKIVSGSIFDEIYANSLSLG